MLVPLDKEWRIDWISIRSQIPQSQKGGKRKDKYVDTGDSSKEMSSLGTLIAILRCDQGDHMSCLPGTVLFLPVVLASLLIASFSLSEVFQGFAWVYMCGHAHAFTHLYPNSHEPCAKTRLLIKRHYLHFQELLSTIWVPDLGMIQRNHFPNNRIAFTW